MSSTRLTSDPCVASCGRSLTHARVRSLASSVAPSARVVIRAERGIR